MGDQQLTHHIRKASVYEWLPSMVGNTQQATVFSVQAYFKNIKQSV